jgi:hypothetical protein
LSDSSGGSRSGPHQLVIRAAFVPDGEDPPAGFLSQFDQLRMPATFDPATGQITCADAGMNLDGDIRAEWHPDEEQGSDEGGTSAGGGSGAPGTGQTGAETPGGSLFGRYRSPATSSFGVTPSRGRAWLGNTVAKGASPLGEASRAAGKTATGAGVAGGGPVSLPTTSARVLASDPARGKSEQPNTGAPHGQDAA